MIESILHAIATHRWLKLAGDGFDLVLVAYVIYRALLVLRGTRAMQMGTGLGIIFVVYIAAKWMGLVTLYNLLSWLLSSIILIVVVVFQNDIRRGLMRVGSSTFFAGMAQKQEERVIDEVVAAAQELARHRMGALICFEQDANLDEFVVSQGTDIDASVQRDLLVSLFVPESVNKLHDGAVILRNYRIAKAGVFFPMPDTKVADKSLGSRHRAALGVTEETDAVVVVVSEERGTISFCFNGNIVPGLDGAQLKTALIGLFGKGARKKSKEDAEADSERIVGRRPSAVPQSGGRASVVHTPPIGTPVPGVLRASLATPPPPHNISIPPPPPSSIPPPSSLRPQSTRRSISRNSEDSVPIVGEPQEPEVRPMVPSPESSAMLPLPTPRPPDGEH